jgi:carbon storage regulator
MIGDSVTVKSLEIKQGQVRIGIDAPRDISVHREEVFRRIQEERFKNVNRTALNSFNPILRLKS